MSRGKGEGGGQIFKKKERKERTSEVTGGPKLCAIGRRPKADNFGSNRGKREKDFWEEFLSLGVTNNTQEQEGKRTFSFSQLQVVKRGV